MRHPSTKIATPLHGVVRALLLGTTLALGHASLAAAQSPVSMPLSADIPAQPLAEALAAFTRQTGLHVVYVSRVVRNQNSRAVPAGLGAEEALARLLEGTGLRFEFLTAHSVRILAAAQDATTQSAPAPEELRPQVPDVLVTGSRIPVPANISATGPLQVVTAQDVLLAGRVDAVDVMDNLPQITSTSTDFNNHSNPSAAAGGFSTIDLRGLKPQRTVVLIDGRRLGLGDPNTANPSPAPDVDQIPVAMIERVEVLTGGASATYGSDAIAGVVNFILKDRVQGVQIDGQYGFAEHTQQNAYVQGAEAAAAFTPPTGTLIDGFTRDLSVLAGTGFHDGDGQLTGYFIYHGQNAVPGSARDFFDCSALSNSYLSRVATQGGFTCLGSSQSNLFGPNAGAGAFYAVVGDQFVPWPAAGSVPPAFLNIASYWSAQRQDTRYQAGLLAHVELSQAVKPYVELAFMEDQTQAYLSPSGLFTGANNLTADGGYLVNCSNPLLSAEEASLLCSPAQIAADRAQPGSASADLYVGRRNVEGGARQTSYQHRNYRAVLGVGGALDDAWSYDAYALEYYTSLSEVQQHYLDNVEISRALQVTTDSAGHPVCISGGDCVPYNIFTSGAVTPQQLAYLYRAGVDGGSNSEEIVHADVTGELARYGLVAPWAHDGVAINAGVEHRTETLQFAPGAAERSGDLSGYGLLAVAIDQRVSVDEGFLEIRAPIAQDRPLARDLTLDAGYRYSAYSTAGATNTYKFDVQFAPIADLRLRASYDHVVRAPNLIELYTPLSYGQSATVTADPCAPNGATHAAASLAQCVHTGVTAAQYGDGIDPAFGGTSTIAQCVFACGVVSGGNAALAPETANTWSLGLTFTPTAIPSLTGSVDYFHIHLTGEIGTVPESVTLQQCLATADPVLCSQIVRTPTGALSGTTVAGGGYILANAVNTGETLISGIDVQASYRHTLPGRWGVLTATLMGSWLQHSTWTPYRTAPSYDCAGLFGNTCLNGAINPTWRHNLRLTWETPWRLELSAQWRFIGGTDYDNNSLQPLLQSQEEGFYDPLLTHIPSYSYLDLAAIWTATDNLQLRMVVNNVLDKDPPFLPLEISHLSGNINTFPPYDLLGREVFVGFRATF